MSFTSTNYIIDSHAHVLHEFFGEEQNAVIERAYQSGVVKMVMPSVDIRNIPELTELSKRYDYIFFAVGLHPSETKNWSKEAEAELRKAISHPKVVAIGECGLDFYHNLSDRQTQIAAFKVQIELARETNKPIIIHCRDAWAEAFELLETVGKGAVKGVFHCFTGNPDMLSTIEKLDFYVSFSGIVTFPNARSIQAAAPLVPSNRILVETDCPFLAPQKMRGKRNEPAYVWMVAEKLAELRNASLSEMSKLVYDNAIELFGLPSL